MKHKVQFPHRKAPEESVSALRRGRKALLGGTYRSGWWPPRSCTWGAGSLSGTGCHQCAPGRSSGYLMTSRQDFSHHRAQEEPPQQHRLFGQPGTAEGPLRLPKAAPALIPRHHSQIHCAHSHQHTEVGILKQYLGNYLYMQGVSPQPPWLPMQSPGFPVKSQATEAVGGEVLWRQSPAKGTGPERTEGASLCPSPQESPKPPAVGLCYLPTCKRWESPRNMKKLRLPL